MGKTRTNNGIPDISKSSFLGWCKKHSTGIHLNKFNIKCKPNKCFHFLYSHETRRKKWKGI